MAQLPVGDAWQRGDENDLSIINDCYCPNCNKSHGKTIMLPTKIPLFREIIIMHLTCLNCHFSNSEVNFGGEIQERGERLTLNVTSYDDMNRQVIKSDSATLIIPQLQFEIPPSTQRGSISTLEGVLKTAADNLSELQPQRLKLGDVDNFHRCRRVIQQLRKYAGGAPSSLQRQDNNNDNNDNDDSDDDEMDESNKKENKKSIFPFTVILDDPAGNSYIENPMAPTPDPNLQSERYFRTPTQDMSLGLQPSQQAVEEGKIDDLNPAHKNIVNVASIASGSSSRPIETDDHHLQNKKKKTQQQKSSKNNSTDDDTTLNVGRQEVMKFPTSCPHCHVLTETDMCITDIPHFKEIIIMSMLCESCGYKSNEIKGGGAIPKYGSKITVTLSQPDDLEREVLKSDTAGIAIPEVELEMEEGGLDGLYTTMEGLLHKIRDRLVSSNPFGSGDSANKHHLTNDGGNFSGPSPTHARYMIFVQKLKDMAEGKIFPFTVIISDPLSNSFVGPIPRDAIALSFQAEKDGNHQCYEDYIDPGMVLEEYERSHEQNEILGLNDMKTENYHHYNLIDNNSNNKKDDGLALEGGAGTRDSGDDDNNNSNKNNNDNKKEYYGTDKPQELPDRLRRLDIRGPDHPHQVGKAPVEGDNTVMGANSLNFAVPSMGKRDTATNANATGNSTATTTTTSNQWATANVVVPKSELQRLLHDVEYHDDTFMMNESYDGSREGMVYKDGAQGLGYYKDISLIQLWEQNHASAAMSTTMNETK